MRTSRPAAFWRDSDVVDPGTRIMSPKVAMTTPSRRESAMAWSMSRLEVTQTGQPGPESRCTPAGMMERKPYRPMLTVWVPQTSIRLICRSPAMAWMESMSRRASAASRKAPKSISLMRRRRRRARAPLVRRVLPLPRPAPGPRQKDREARAPGAGSPPPLRGR